MSQFNISCDYCRRDVTLSVYISCAECEDFDLCVQCMAAGVSIKLHRNTHRYRVIDNQHRPLFEYDWAGREELLLLEGCERFGLGNWTDIANHVGGRKSAEQCQRHYFKMFIRSGNDSLLPDMNVSVLLPENETAMAESAVPYEEDDLPDHSYPKTVDPHGYMPLRGDFEVEYAQDAELLIRDVVFDAGGDTSLEVRLKTAALEIFNETLIKRQERKNYAILRGLTNLATLQQDGRSGSKREQSIRKALRRFLRYLSPSAGEELIQGLVVEELLRRRVRRLQEYRARGITTLSAGELYDAARRKRDLDRTERREREAALITYANSTLSSSGGSGNTSTNVRAAPSYAPPTSGPANWRAKPLDLIGAPGLELLSETEKQVCSYVRLMPEAYISMKSTMIRASEAEGGLRLAGARKLFKIDVNKTRKVYDFVLDQGWIKLLQESSSNS